jgi:hypothetical protein
LLFTKKEKRKKKKKRESKKKRKKKKKKKKKSENKSASPPSPSAHAYLIPQCPNRLEKSLFFFAALESHLFFNLIPTHTYHTNWAKNTKKQITKITKTPTIHTRATLPL